jgi:hypothetical protein
MLLNPGFLDPEVSLRWKFGYQAYLLTVKIGFRHGGRYPKTLRQTLPSLPIGWVSTNLRIPFLMGVHEFSKNLPWMDVQAFPCISAYVAEMFLGVWMTLNDSGGG